MKNSYITFLIFFALVIFGVFIASNKADAYYPSSHVYGGRYGYNYVYGSNQNNYNGYDHVYGYNYMYKNNYNIGSYYGHYANNGYQNNYYGGYYKYQNYNYKNNYNHNYEDYCYGEGC